MYSELWQVTYGDKFLSGMRKPENRAEIVNLQANDVGGIITLLSDEENHVLYQNNNMPFLWLPVNGGTPMSEWQLEQAIKFVKQQLTANATVAVHCSNGHKRTGTLLAALLIKNGASTDDAIRTVITANPKADGMSPKQRAFLASLKI